MNINPISDLHLEFFSDLGTDFISNMDSNGVDVLLLAGDIIPVGKYKTRAVDRLKQIADKYPQVVYVTGNHCYWGSHYQDTLDILNSINISNFHYLENNIAVINGQRFLGATLWFEEQAAKAADPYSWCDWSDFIAIRGGASNWIFNKHTETIDFLTANMKSDDVVLTHHLPSHKCVDPKFHGSRYNCYFANNLDDLILERQPKLMAFGHTHSSVNLTIGKTRLIANPYGYHGRELNQYFNPNLILKV